MSGGNRKLLSYAFAVAAPLLAAAVKLALEPWISRDVPFLLSAIAVMAAAWVGGFVPGILATLLSAFVNEYLFLRPFNSIELFGSAQVIQLGLFTIEGLAVSLLCAKLQAARRRAEVSEREARDLERQILEISDAEQRRIGHDLHDGLGQHLTGIALMARRLSQRLEKDQPALMQQATEVADLAKRAVEWTHDLSRALMPPALELHGLSEALRELAANAEAVFGIVCSVQVRGIGAIDLPLSAGVHLYRIAQEAISNSVRHGRAKQVEVRLIRIDESAELTITDDGGRPTSTDTVQPHGGMGLRIMRYRANMIGATFRFERAEHQGTTVRCIYPLPTTSAHVNSR